MKTILITFLFMSVFILCLQMWADDLAKQVYLIENWRTDGR